MKAMEQQIASLTGLVQHALLTSPNTSGTNEALSAALPSESGSTPALPGSAPFQANLFQFKKNVSDLRLQLHQMRQLQLQNQEALCVQLKRAEQEISIKLAEAMKHLEDPVQRQRALVEEDRREYLGLEERVLNQLEELEHYVDTLKRETSSAGAHRAVTLKHVEEGAVSLRKVGESLAGLRGEFPPLQTRMRSVLRVEVEAVKFLKEEPHKLDSMLKRVKCLTETLSSLRRCATTPIESSPATSTMVDPDPPAEPPASPSALPEPQISSIRSEVVMPSCPMVIHHGRDSPSSAKGSTGTASSSNSNPSSQGGSPAQQKKTPAATASANQELPTQALVNNGSNGTGNFFIEEILTKSSKSKNRAMSIKAAEKEWEERRQNMGHYDGREFERILDEAQANMMKGIPCREVPSEGEASAVTPAALEDQVDSPKPVTPTTEETPPEPSSEKPAIAKLAGPEKLPKPVLEKPTDKVGKVSLEASKSPPPPPPRKTFSSSGMTTTRSGEVVYTSRNESASGQEEEEAEVPAAQRKPTKIPPETTPSTPAPVAASAIHEEEDDEGDKIMAELQVFQKCTVKDVGVKSSVLETHPTRVEPQIRELRPGALLPLKEKKQSSENTREDKDPNADENGNTTPLRQSPGVIYYVTGQISKEQPPPLAPVEEAPECRDNPTLSPSQNATSVASPSSRMPVPMSAKSRQSPGTTTDKAGKQQKLQDSAQRQFRQTQNGRAPSSSFSSPSPLSPTPLGPGVKSIRTIHTPSFTSYKPQNGSSGKSCIPTATAAKDST
ncbi:unnamed protein product [Oncorhynchus mykiss]|uniref:Actin interacting protein 3-like C-terminal domain-containing protein n=1 Tax=Oncorhynchus mykiss TaxID=8022 RepID=A0A060VPZ2_ONCMY|nr:unnamed protein product [Oncorhynchus mykiss]